MRIAQISPLIESVPPKVYGGTERVVYYLTEELVRRGHDVSLFASGDSQTHARLVPCSEQALRLDPHSRDHLAHQVVMLRKVFEDTSRFDILHFHIDYLHYLLASRQSTPVVTTQHGRMDIPDLQAIYREFPNQSLVSISNHQRIPLPKACWLATVYHGLPTDAYRFQSKHGNYLAFLGRLSPEKDPVSAIEIAARLGIPLKIAAKIDPVEREFYDLVVAPLIRKHRKYVEYVGEIGEKEKNEFLGNAMALLFPIRWPEPFGLVLIESLACGTPVIACPRGAVPEIIEDGATGYFMETIDDGLRAVEKIGEIDRQLCRNQFIKRFSVARMTDEYLRVYEKLIHYGK